MDHWFLKLLLLLQKPSDEEAVHSRPLSQGNEDMICLWEFQFRAGLSCIPALCQVQSVQAVPRPLHLFFIYYQHTDTITLQEVRYMFYLIKK